MKIHKQLTIDIHHKHKAYQQTQSCNHVILHGKKDVDIFSLNMF